MKNKQGFLPNLLNKYGIRKLSAGTASLLIGATLVFGINGQVKAAETDNIVSQNGDNKTNDSESSDKELVKSEDDKTSNTSTDTNLESEFEQNNNPSSIEESTNRNEEDTLNQRTSTETEKDTHVKSADTQTTNETTNKNDDNATTNHTESISDESTYQSDDSKTTQHDNSNTNQDTQSTLNPTSKESSNKDEATSPTPKESTSIEKTNLLNDANHQTTDEVNHSDSDNMTNSTPNDTENELDTTQLTSHDESPSPQSDNFTGFTNLMATPLNLRNDNPRINLLAATEDTKPKTYTKPNNSEYSYLLNDLGYDATTVKENSNLRHAGISQSQDNTGSVIKLNLTKWLSLQRDFVNGGKVNLSFAQSDFYTQIESITLSGVKMDTTNNGQNWSAPINGSTVNSGEIGSVTNHDIVITLKNSQTLSSLGYSNNKPVYLTHTWTTNDGAIAEESIQVASITPTLDSKAPNTTQKSGFTAGRMTNKIKYDSSQNSIKSVHTFKPNENFLQTDYRAVLYIKEQVNKELIPYIDPNSVKLYVSDPDGNPISQDRYVNGSIDNDGLFDSSKINEISIKNNNTSGQLSNARTSLDRNVFFGTLGQSRSYTISYKLKDGYTLESIASKVSARETFDSWMEVDYLDSYDSGTPNKRLLGSYASSYIDIIDRIPPVAPKANNITTEDTSIKGTAEADTNINLAFNDGRTLNGKVDSNGNFSIAIPSDYVLTGKETIKITSIDKGDNVSPAITISVIDKTPPAVKAISNKTQEVNTEIEPIKIEAKDNSGQAVTNKVEGLPDGVTFDEATNTISGTPTEVGKYLITITTIDKDGNTATTTLTINIIDTTAPEQPTINKVTENSTEVSGRGEPGTIVEVTFPDGNKVEGKVDSDGNYHIQVPSETTLKGGQPLQVIAIDKAGNKSESTTTTVIDTTAPEQPTINKVTENSTEVSGRGEPGTIVEVTFPDGNKVEDKVDSDGNYHIQIPSETTLKGGQPLQVIAIDKAGNKSESTTTNVIDTTAPEQPTINKVTENSTEVSGRGEPGTVVEVTFPDGNKVEGKVDSDGNYHIQIPSDERFKVGQQLIVKVVDEEGNVSEPSITMVQKEDMNSEKPSTVTDTITKNNSKSLNHKASEQQSYHNKSEKIKSVNKPTKIVEKDMSTYDYSRYSKDISNKNNKSATFEQQNVSDINNNQYSRNKVNQPVKKSRKNEINKDLPQTGEENFNKSTLFGTLVASLGALLLFFKRRKKDENDEKE
ncbi:YSIRK-type signal peptide-containing protein [Staphylococcus epidermidis]|nr:YSIRK-type signal peptide-containing protein [Staphylococcus epidermidis]